MTLPAELLNFADAAGAWLLTYLIHSTLLLGVALIACRWLGDAQLSLQESLVRVALVGGLLTASLQSGLGWQAATGSIPYPSARTAAVVETGPVEPAATPGPALRSEERTVASRETVATSALPAGSTPIPWLALAVTLWSLTGLFLVGRLGLLALRLSSRLRGRVEMTHGSVFRMFWRLLAVADVDKPTRLTRSARLEVPIALGVGRREISLPDRVVEELPEEQQETVLAHELAHLERRDPTWLLAGRVIESIFFVQPLNRLARRKLQEIAEYRCDDWAAEFTGRPLTLAKCLTNVATWSADRRLSALAPTMAGRRSGLGQRVRRLLDPGYSGLDPKVPSWWRPIAGAALVAVIVAVPGFSTVAQEAPAAPEPPAPVEDAADAPEAPETPETPESTVPAPPAPEAEPEDGVAVAPVVPAAEVLPTLATPVAPEAPPVLPDAPEPVVAPVPQVEPEVEVKVEAAIAPRVEVRTEVVVPDPEVKVATRIARSVTVAPEVAVRTSRRVEVSTPVRVEVRLQHEDEQDESEPEQERDHDQDYDHDDDWDDDWEDELEDELDALEDELDEMMDELEEIIEFEFETQLDALEDELDALEDELEEGLEFEIEMFEEELESDLEAFEDELDEIEERVEERLESVDWDAREEKFERELEAIEDSFDGLEDQLDDELDRIEDRLEDHLERILEPMVDHELEHRIEAIEDRIDREADRLEEMAERMSEDAYARGERHLSLEDREALLAEAKRIAEEARPSPEELEQLRAELDRLAGAIRPSEAELEKIRHELLESLEVLREQAERGLAKEKAELQQLRQKHKVL